MTTNNMPGLVGEVYEYLCGRPGVDTGLAQGAALDVVARAARTSDQFFVPAAGTVIGVKDGVTKFAHLNFGTILFGPEDDCHRVVAGADSVLATAGAPEEPSPLAPLRSSPLTPQLRQWCSRTAPAWLPAPGTWVDGPLLVGASGIHRKVTRLPPYNVPSSLTIGLRATMAVDGPVLVRIPPSVAEELGKAMVQVVRHALAAGTTAGPHLKQWMLVLATLAIGVNPRTPVILDDLLPATLSLVGGHSMIVRSFQPDTDRAQMAH